MATYINVWGSGSPGQSVGQIVAVSGYNIRSVGGTGIRTMHGVTTDGLILMDDGSKNYPFYVGMDMVDAVSKAYPTGVNVVLPGSNLGQAYIGATGGGLPAGNNRTTFFLGGNYTSRAN